MTIFLFSDSAFFTESNMWIASLHSLRFVRLAMTKWRTRFCEKLPTPLIPLRKGWGTKSRFCESQNLIKSNFTQKSQNLP
ncbi:hypothetical protein [Helicobacter sp. 23-1045]